jgi:hypothetical protein
LVHEGIAARIRHRALIKVLSSGRFDFAQYKKAYSALFKRDSAALAAQTLLSEANYLSIFKEWQRQDVMRYGVSRPSKQRSATKARRKAKP